MSVCARIIGTGSYLPKRKITNEQIEKMVSNFDPERAGMPFPQWVERVTGIRTRYFVEDEDTESMTAKAGQKALEAAGLKATDLDFIIISSFTPTRDIPNLACSVIHLLGAGNIGGFPLNTACAGFIYALSMGYVLIKAGMYKNILVASAETLTKVTNYGDPTTAVLFADGAGAVVIQAADEGGICSQPYLSSEITEHFDLKNANTTPFEKRTGDEGCELVPHNKIHMPGGPQVLRRAVNGMGQALLEALEKSPYELEDLDVIIPHQANRRITDGLVEKLGIPEEKVCRTIDLIGNTSGSTIAISLDMAVRGKLNGVQIKPGDIVGLTAVGAGYSIGAIVFEY